MSRVDFMDEPNLAREVHQEVNAIYYRNLLLYLQSTAERFGWTLARTDTGDLRDLPADVRHKLAAALAVAKQVMRHYRAERRNFEGMVREARWDVEDGDAETWLGDLLQALARRGIYPVRVPTDRPHDEAMAELFREDHLLAATMLAEIRSRPGDVDLSEGSEYRALLRQLVAVFGLDWEHFTDEERQALAVVESGA